MQAYLNLLNDIKNNGIRKKSRPVLKSTGTSPDTFAVFGRFFQHDLAEGFPLLTTKKMSLDQIAVELCWMIQGTDDTTFMEERNCNIWKQWTSKHIKETNGVKTVVKERSVGPCYGSMWRHWKYLGGEIDQLGNVIKTLKSNPSDRRMIVSAWNPPEIPLMGLPPCHMIFQFGVLEDRLNLAMFQRSADVFLGVPYNIASYALLIHLIAHLTGFKPGTLSIMFGDVHIYENHLDQVTTQLTRTPHKLPKLTINPELKYLDFVWPSDFILTDYTHDSALRGEVAV
jgi:thymidylate synthase